MGTSVAWLAYRRTALPWPHNAHGWMTHNNVSVVQCRLHLGGGGVREERRHGARYAIQHLEDSTVTYAHIDFVHEARNAEQCARNFKARRDIVVPRIVWPLTSSRVLTMEFMHGNKVRKSIPAHIMYSVHRYYTRTCSDQTCPLQ